MKNSKLLSITPLSRAVARNTIGYFRALSVTIFLGTFAVPTIAADMNAARFAEYLSIHLSALNSDTVRPSFEQCQRTVSNTIIRSRSSIEQQIANSESRSRTNELQRALKGFENERYNSRIFCFGMATVLIQEVFTLEDRGDDVSYLKSKFADVTPAGWRSFAEIFQLEPSKAFRAAAARVSGEFATQIGSVANSMGSSLGASEADMARQSRSELSAMSEQMTVIRAGRLGKQATEVVKELHPLIYQFLMLDRAMRLDPTTPSKIKLPEPTRSEYIFWSQQIAKDLKCSIPNNDVSATNLGLGDIVCL